MKLEHGEAFNAAVAGLQRKFRAIQRGAVNNDGGLSKDEIASDIHGAIAECLVAKTLGLYCNFASPDRSLADVGGNIEVRSTPHKNGSLVVRPRDKDDRKYYLVAGIYPNIRIIGWKLGIECKEKRFWISTDKEGKPLEYPFWLVPQHELNTELFEITL